MAEEEKNEGKKEANNEVEVESEKKKCNARIDELAKPNKRLLMAVWENYRHLFTPDRKEYIKALLQELFAMTPEETEKYFMEISRIMEKLDKRSKLKVKYLRRYKAKIRSMARNKAYKLFAVLLKKAMWYAVKNPVPAIISPRLRIMSDVILEQLCDLRGISVPKRTDNDCLTFFLLSISDWMSLAIEHLYYQISVYKNKELERIQAEFEAEEERKRLEEEEEEGEED